MHLNTMTWFPVFVFLLISIGASLCDDYTDDAKKCLAEKFERCDKWIEKHPETADELLDACQKFTEILACPIQAQDECGTPVRDRKREELNFVETLCDKENPTFKVISENLQCIEEYKKYTDLCGPPIRKNEKFSSFDQNEARIWEEDREAGICLDFIRWSTCEAIITGYTCNDPEVKEAVKQVRQYGKVVKECTSENLEKLKPVLEEYETLLLDVARSYE